MRGATVLARARRGVVLLVGVAALGCTSTPKATPIDVASLPVARPVEEVLPSLAQVRTAPRVLVLPLADRTAPQRIGRIHNAIDDLLRRDLMALPDVAVFPAGSLPIPVPLLYQEGYRGVDTAVDVGKRVGATHVLIGEVATDGNQTAIEVDLVDVAAGRVQRSVRVQQTTRRLDRELRRLRTQVATLFHDDPTLLDAVVPGYTPPHDILQACGYAQDRVGSGEYSQALIDYYSAAKRDKPYAGAYVGIAETQLLLGGTDIAERSFAIALGHDPDHVEAYWRYALMRIQMGRGGRDALALCQEAARRAPLFGPAHLTLGTLWFDEKEYDQAERHFQIAAALLPRSAWPLYNHAHVLRVRGDLEGARAAFEQAAAVSAGEARIHFDLALVLKDLGRRDEALTAFRTAANLDTDNPLYLYYVGEQLEGQGRAREALAAYEAAAAYPFSHIWLHRKLGEAFVRAERWAQAERVLGDGYADGERGAAHVLLYARVLLYRGQANPIRRRDYSSRAAQVLAPLLETPLTEVQRAEARELAASAAQMQRR